MAMLVHVLYGKSGNADHNHVFLEIAYSLIDTATFISAWTMLWGFPQ